jgi:hypothetical protein
LAHQEVHLLVHQREVLFLVEEPIQDGVCLVENHLVDHARQHRNEELLQLHLDRNVSGVNNDHVQHKAQRCPNNNSLALKDAQEEQNG